MSGGSMFECAFQHFRFYEDGTETGATPRGDEDADVGIDNVANAQFHLRCALEEVGAGSIGGAATDDYTIDYQVNGSGGWITVTAVSARCRTDTASDLTDDGVTTEQLTAGAGSFIEGVQEEGDGEVTDFELTADNYTEHVWALELVAADNSDTDTLTFRLERNGSAITLNVAPIVTIEKAGVPTPQAVGGFTVGPTADGPKTTSKSPGGFDQAPLGALVTSKAATAAVGGFDQNPLGALIRQTSKSPGGFDQNPLGALVRQTSKTVGGFDVNPLGALSAGKLAEQDVGGYDQNPLGALSTVFTRLLSVGAYDENPTATLVRQTSKFPGTYDQPPTATVSTIKTQHQTVGGYDQNPTGDLNAVKLALQTAGEYDQNPLGALSTILTRGATVGSYDQNPVAALRRQTSKTLGGFDQAPLATLIRQTSKTVGSYDQNPLGALSTVFTPGGGGPTDILKASTLRGMV